ncbi:MAG: hypothetical protein U0166_19550 [Acidobacteriota bacterium]
MAVEEEGDLVLGERPEAGADADTLGERVVLGFAETFTQEGLAGEDQREGATAVEVVGC